MEWIIGIIVSIVLIAVWSVLKRYRENDLKEAVGQAYSGEGDFLAQEVSWRYAKRFSKKRGGEVSVLDDGGQATSVEMLVYGDNVTVTFSMNRENGKTIISAQKTKKKARMKDFTVTETVGTDGVKIVFVGVGGGGINIIDNYIANEYPNANVKTMAIDDNSNSSLNKSSADIKVKLEREKQQVLGPIQMLKIVKLFRDRNTVTADVKEQ